MSDNVDRILADTLDLPSDDRAAFLDRACEGDDTLRAEVESLLAVDDEAGAFLEVPAMERLHRPRFAPGDTIGRYEILRLIGTGSAGSVYLALQDEPRREVALKVMHAGLGSEDAVRRFRAEAAMLAHLHHPDIAHVYEAGVESGVPWFAMEYVPESQTLVQFAQPLSERERLETFARVCDAVHHAHQKGIVHRDLKPENVLVRESGQPKVIDFSIARPAGDTPEFIAGTLPYMSPEHGEPAAHVDIRSDIYSLGVILFELLRGERPYDVSSPSIADARRVVAIAEPSTLPGDIGAVVAMALAKDPEERYRSAAGLGQDVRRVLRHVPVEARPASWTHQTILFVRRRTALALALAGLIGVLVAGVIVSLRYAVEAARERDASSRQAYLANVFAASAALRVHDPAEAERRLEAAPLAQRDWEWHYLRGRLDGSVRRIDGMRDVVDATSDGKRMAACNTTEARVWDMASGTLLRTIATTWSYAVALHGDRLVVADWETGVSVFDVSTGARIGTIEGVGRVTDLAFDVDGKRLAIAGRDGRAHVHADRMVSWKAHRSRTISITFGAGDRVATGGHDGGLSVWNATTGARVARMEGHHAGIESVAFHSDGVRLVTGSHDGMVGLWRTDRATPLALVRAHNGSVRRVMFTPDGASFLSASYDRTIGLWSADDARLLGRYAGHRAEVAGLEVHQDAPVSFARDGTIRFWSARPPSNLLPGHRHLVVGLAFGPGDRLAAIDQLVSQWCGMSRGAARSLARPAT